MFYLLILLSYMSKLLKYLSLIILFLLPFQTRLIYKPAYLGGYFMEWFSGSIYAVEILIWIVIILTFFRLILNKKFWTEINQVKDKKDRLMKIVRPTIFLLALVVYLFIVPLDRDLAQMKIFFLLGGACFAVTLLLNKISFKQISLMLWSGGVLQAIIGTAQFIIQRTWATKWLGWALHQQSDLGAAVLQTGGGERWLRAYGSFGWPNDLGFYLSIMFILGFWLYQKTQKEKEKIMLSIGQLLIMAGLFFSFSRAAIIALLVGLLWIFWREGKKILQPLFWPIILFVILSIIYLPLLQSRVTAENYLESRSINERVGQYGEFKNIFEKHPMLGVGPGNYVYVLFIQNPGLSPWFYQPVHNVYLLFLAKWGIIGVIFILFLAYWFFKEIWKNNREILPLWVLVVTAFLFDHYFYTSYSGILIICILVALSVKGPYLTSSKSGW